MSSIRSLLAKLRQPSSAADSDRMLLARFASTGDESAFAAIVDRHGSLVLGVCRRTIRDTHLAEDAFQAVFIVLARKAESLSVRESLANWLYVVARRIAVKAAKRKDARLVSLEDVADPVLPNRVESWEIQQIIDEELSRLPEKYRSPLIAFHLQDRTQDETASLLGWSLSTVRRRLETGRELLRDRLAARGVTLGATAIVSATTVPSVLASQAISLVIAIRSGEVISPHLLKLVREGLPMSNFLPLVALGFVAAVGIGVAVVADEPKPKDERKLLAAPAGQSAKWSTIKGQVLWGGTGENAVAINVTNDKEHCLSKGGLVSDEVVINAKNGGLKNVWVYLRPDSDDREAKFPVVPKVKAKEHAVDQPCCLFEPRILAVREGDTILFKNSSPIPHNVDFSSTTPGLEFNVTTPSGQTHTTKPLLADRNPTTFKCSIHPWMKGRVMIFDHPYFALTDADGNFEIKNAPVGKFRILYRHELGYHKGRDGAKGFPLEIAGPTMTLEPLKYEPPKP